MIYSIAVLVYTSLITILSITEGYSQNTTALLLSALTVVFVLRIQQPKNVLISIIKLVCVCAFHMLSNMELCLIIYILYCGISFESKGASWIRLLYSIPCFMGFLTISYFTKDLTMQHNFIAFSLFMAGIFFVSIWLFFYIIRGMRERNILSTRDSLTGLINYASCHVALQNMVEQERNFLLILIDCNDLKSMNTSKGFQAGNQFLQQVSVHLQTLFKDAPIIARFGGDEFAVAIYFDDYEQSTLLYQNMLDKDFPQLTQMQVTYGMAAYPHEGLTKDDLLTIAEHSLYSKKRENWLRKEEHLLRSEKLRVVGELASGMAHEIRNPLTTIKGFLQISKANNYNIEAWYDLIMSEITRMNDLTGEFLHFSRPNAEYFKISDMNLCIQRVISLTESEALRRGHQMIFQLPDYPIPVLMDPDKIVQVLINLIKNAYDAMTEKGTITINLSTISAHVVIEVEDTGKGIPNEQLKDIFHPFFTTKSHGTGLGLAITHKIIQDHGGTIEVTSTVGKGTKFVLKMPVAQEEEPSYSEKVNEAV
jgi:diguanylate cyclase (GGDEF)-like protein